ncbi:MAG: FAD/NAD(P)-binding protein [bacterium]
MSESLPDPMVPFPYLVSQVKQETHDTFSLELDPANGRATSSFQPGQFNMLYVFGVGEVPISISGDPTLPQVLTHTTRVVGAVTKAMRQLKRGDALGIRGPFGAPWPVEQARGRDVVIVAGGIGLAPLRPVLYRIVAERDKFGRIVLLYGSRTPDDILYKRELQKWRAQLDLEVYVTVDHAMSGWRGNVGVVTTLIPKAPFDPLSCLAMICGPEVMMRFTVQQLLKRGVTRDRIFLSMERNMKCGCGFCGHCQMGPTFVCKDGPVYRYDQIESLLGKREL